MTDHANWNSRDDSSLDTPLVSRPHQETRATAHWFRGRAASPVFSGGKSEQTTSSKASFSSSFCKPSLCIRSNRVRSIEKVTPHFECFTHRREEAPDRKRCV